MRFASEGNKRASTMAQKARWIDDKRGATAAEFALVAPFFFLFLLGIIDLSLTLFSQAIMDGAVRDAARLIRTGQVQLPPGSSAGGAAAAAAAFTQQLCADTSGNGGPGVGLGILNCAQFFYDVENFANFGAVTQPALDKNGNLQNIFTPGNPGDVVAVRVSYSRPFLIPEISMLLNPNGNLSMMSTVIFKNEPFIQNPPS